MSIEIKMRNEKWRLGIQNEELEFQNDKDLKTVIEYLMNLKTKHGKLNSGNKTKEGGY